MNVIFWIAAGGPYIKEAQASARSAARHMKGTHRILLTPDSTAVPGFDRVLPLPPRRSGLWYLDSTNYLVLALDLLSDYSRLIWLDVDTYVCGSLQPIFDLLPRYDLVGTHSPARVTSRTVEKIPSSFPEINVGVLGLHNTPRLRAFAGRWLAQYQANQVLYGDNDQGPLRDVLWSNGDVKFYILPPEFDFRFNYGGYARLPVAVLHGRDGNYEEIAKIINGSTAMRTYSAGYLQRLGKKKPK